MAYQLKYFFEFQRTNTGEQHRVELYQDTDLVLTPEEVTAGVPPFTIQLMDIEHKFKPVRATGCNITLFSDTGFKFFLGLDHIDPQEFMIKHLINGAINWIGFLNADMYTEPYDQESRYLISVSGNDGFALLDQMRFVNSDGSHITSNWALLQLIWYIAIRLKLPLQEIRVALSTTFDLMGSDGSKNVLTSTFVEAGNFYDEDDKPATLREVLDAILEPFGAFIIQQDGYWYITDHNTVAKHSSVTFQRYAFYFGPSYAGNVTIDMRKTTSEIGFRGRGQNLERSGGINRQVVSYSPYPKKDIIPNSLISMEEFETVPPAYSVKNGYNYKTLTGHDQLAAENFEESYQPPDGEKSVYAWWPRHAANTVVFQTKPENDIMLNIAGASLTDWAIGSVSGRRGRKLVDGVAFLIEGEILTKVTANPYTSSSFAPRVKSLQIGYKIQVGKWWFDQSQNGFYEVEKVNTLTTYNKKEPIGDKWTPMGMNGVGIFAPLIQNFNPIIFSGEFNFYITNFALIGIDNRQPADDSRLLEIWLRNLSINVVRIGDGSELDDEDIEYVGLLNKYFANEGDDKKLTIGTMAQYADRGKVMRYDSTTDTYYLIKKYSRDGQTFKLEELLLNSICSNYSRNFITLNGMNLRTGFKLYDTITDAYAPGKVFMIQQAEINYRDDVAATTLTEIAGDILTIQK